MSFSTPPVVDRQTFYASQSAVAVALNKSMLSINNGASGKVLKIQNVFIVNSQITAVVGNVVQFDLLRTTSIIGRGMSSTFHKGLLRWLAATPLPRSTAP